MSIIRGNIKSALGFGSITVGGLEIDMSKAKAKDLVDFQEMPIKAVSGKKQEDLTSEDYLKINKCISDWFVKFFMDKEPTLDFDDVELFVIKHKQELQKEFTIAFGFKTREQYELDEAKASENLKKKD